MSTRQKKIVYCSGPLFSPEEIGSMSSISGFLESKGFTTFLPHRDGVENYVMGMVNSSLNVNFFKIRDMIDAAIFSLDLFQIIERCNYFVFNMNGRVPDEGGVVETAIAFSVGKPVVIYKNDARTVFNGMDNSMITGLMTTKPVKDIKRIPLALEKAKKKIDNLPESTYLENIPPLVKKKINFGRRVWTVLEKINRGEKKRDSLVEEISKICLDFPEILS